MSRKFKINQYKHNGYIIITIALLFVLGPFLVMFYEQNISNNIIDWAAFGNYIGGTFGLVSVYLMYLIFKEQNTISQVNHFETMLFENTRILREFFNINCQSNTCLINAIIYHFRQTNSKIELARADVFDLLSHYYLIHRDIRPSVHVYVYLLNMVKNIDGTEFLTKTDRFKYVDFIRLQLPNEEILGMFFYLLYTKSQLDIILLDKYNFFRSMQSYNCMIDTMKDLIFENTTFEYKFRESESDNFKEDFNYERIDYKNELWYETLERLKKQKD